MPPCIFHVIQKIIFAEDVDMGGDGSDSMAIYGTNTVLKLESFGHNF